MVFSDSSGGQGIVQDIDFWVNTNATIYPIADKTRNVNRWLDVCVSDILSADSRWQWDDTNQTDLPRATTNLISGQQQYSFDSNWLVVERVDILDPSGGWQMLSPIDQADIHMGYGAFLNSSGTPIAYDVDGENIFLFPSANYNSTGGLKVFFQRKPVYFTTTDTTNSPGFASSFHRILSLGAAHDWCMAKDIKKATVILAELNALRDQLKAFYSNRNKYEHIRIQPFNRAGLGRGDYE